MSAKESTNSWWLRPGDEAARFPDAHLVFESDDGGVWTFTLHMRSGRTRSMRWDHGVERFISQAFASSAGLQRVMINLVGSPRGWALDEHERQLLDFIADGLQKEAWVEERTLLARLKWAKPTLDRLTERLEPRYLFTRTAPGTGKREFGPTFPGLLRSSRRKGTVSVVQAFLDVIREQDSRREGIAFVNVDDVAARSALPSSRSWTTTVLEQAGLIRPEPRDEIRRTAPDIGKLVEFRSSRQLRSYFRTEASSRLRCWPTAPLAAVLDLDVSFEASGGAPTRSVFISYRRGSKTLDQWVCGLADELSSAGLDVQLDQWIRNPSGGWGPWSRRGIENSNFVLSVCTPGYRAAFDQTEGEEGKGVHWEGHYIEQCLYEARSRNDRFIPILLEDGSELDIPGPLRGGTFYRLPQDADALLNRLVWPVEVAKKR